MDRFNAFITLADEVKVLSNNAHALAKRNLPPSLERSLRSCARDLEQISRDVRNTGLVLRLVKDTEGFEGYRYDEEKTHG